MKSKENGRVNKNVPKYWMIIAPNYNIYQNGKLVNFSRAK
jgi:hypothetical protein